MGTFALLGLLQEILPKAPGLLNRPGFPTIIEIGPVAFPSQTAVPQSCGKLARVTLVLICFVVPLFDGCRMIVALRFQLTLRRYLLLALVVAFAAHELCAQQPAAAAPAPGQPGSQYRRLVPGVETTIMPDRQANETFSHQDMVEIKANFADILKWQPKTLPDTQTLRFYADKTQFHRSVWSLEFAFLPMRMIQIDFPTANGKLQQKMVWYMVYRVQNLGQHLQPSLNADGVWEVKPSDQPTTTEGGVAKPIDIRFVPTFSLETLDKKKAYLDRVIPVAMEAIQKREDPNRRLLNSAEIAQVPLAVGTKEKDTSVWGVAMWEEIDPRIDRFSIYVGGLTNAYRFIDPPGAFAKDAVPGTGRLLQTKYLQLNFWRPSDEFTTTETEIYYGLPITGPDGNETVIDHRWIFR